DIAALDITGFFEALLKGAQPVCGEFTWLRPNVTDHRRRRLLRPRRQRPRGRCTTNKRDELAALHLWHHSITSSGRARSAGCTTSPSNRAACRLMTSSNLIACTTGKSAGLAPLRMRRAYSPTWRYMSEMLVP